MTKPTSQEEIKFLVAVAGKGKKEYVRDIANQFALDNDVAYKRILYWLGKWSGKGWYNYGVALDLGWLEDKGIEEARKHIAGIEGKGSPAQVFICKVKKFTVPHS